MRKKLIGAALAIVLSAAMVLAGCGGQDAGGGEDLSGISNNTVAGRKVFVHDSNVAFWGMDNLLCSAKFQEGSLSEFVVEAGFTGDIYALAVYDNSIFVSASDGIFSYSLDMFGEGGSGKPVTLTTDYLSEFNHFEIYDGNLYFLYGDVLSYIPTSGGDRTELAEQAGDFEVTDRGIYYTKVDGTLHLLSLDGSEDTEVANVAPACPVTISGGRIYYRDQTKLMSCDLASGKSEEISTDAVLSECMPWTDGSGVLYQDEEYNDRLITADGETEIGQDYNYPLKSYGCVYSHYLAGIDTAGSEIRVTDLESGTVRTYDLKTELASELATINGGGSGSQEGSGADDTSGGEVSSGGPSGSSGSSSGSSSGEYNILDGYQTYEDGSVLYIYGNDFMLTMPNANDWSLEQNSNDSFSIYFLPSKNAGWGGHLMTIVAYDPDDTSYEQLPSYRVAGRGLNADKVFIAEFPTDVQYDPSDETQAARYRELYDYLQKVGAGAVSSPLQTSDSD